MPQPSAWEKRGPTREHALLRQRHRVLQRALVGERAEIGGEEHRHVAGGGIHLAGAGPVEGALLVAGRAHRPALGAVALHRARPQRRRELAARIAPGTGSAVEVMRSGAQQVLLLERADRGVEPALQGEPQQHEAGVGIDVLLAGLMAVVGLPGVEIADEVGQRVGAAMPGLDLLRRAGEA